MTANARRGAHDHGDSLYGEVPATGGSAPYGEVPATGAAAPPGDEALWEREVELRLVDEAIERLCEDREGGG
ncbi:hypothetical protein G3I76_40235, partial [Streptomyces sp. SID11233]|nr:hypothetical protein [Streptomyces sp. SID11233]